MMSDIELLNRVCDADLKQGMDDLHSHTGDIMSDLNGGYTLNRHGLLTVERSAWGWARDHKNVFDGAATHEEIDQRYETARSDRMAAMPEFLESDEDFETYFSECRLRFNLESACDAAHEKIDPAYFAEEAQ